MFRYTGSEQTVTVHAGVSSLHVVAAGAPGGQGTPFDPNPSADGGLGAQVTADLADTPGEVLEQNVAPLANSPTRHRLTPHVR